MEFFLGGIIIFGGTYAPKDWAMCRGQLVAISQNQALFALLGNTYGGDGRTTFGIPDLQGRTAIGFGSGAGLPSYSEGVHVGFPTTQLTTQHMANHTHTATVSDITVTGAINASDGDGNTNSPRDAYLATPGDPHKLYNTVNSSPTTLASGSLSITSAGGTVAVEAAGNSQAFSIMQPSIAMNYIIAMQGIFPSRN